MPKKTTATKRRNIKHAARLLRAMCIASQEPQPASGWLRLAGQKRRAELGAALRAYAPDAKSANGVGWALKDLVDQTFVDDAGEEFTLKSRFFPGDASHRYGVASRLRERILKRRESKQQRKDTIDVTAKAIAKQLRRGQPVSTALIVETAADRSSRQAVEIARREFWDLPRAVTRPQPVPAPAPEVPEPEPWSPPVVDAAWPPAWRKHGRPTYATPVRIAPDESFKNSSARIVSTQVGDNVTTKFVERADSVAAVERDPRAPHQLYSQNGVSADASDPWESIRK